MKFLTVLIAVGAVMFLLLTLSRDDVEKTAKKAESAASEITSRLAAAKERFARDDKARDGAPASAGLPPLDSKSPAAGVPLEPTAADVMARPAAPARDSANPPASAGATTPEDVMRANKDAAVVERRVAEVLNKYFGDQ